MRYLTIALAKGRLAELAVAMFEKGGYNFEGVKQASRKLIFQDDVNKIRYFLAKPTDVPTYVEYGAADIGVCGKDTLLEDNKMLYEVLNLGFGACRMVVAGPEQLRGKLDEIGHKRVATKYPKIAKDYFERKKFESVEIIKLSGSVELAPLVGLSEVIVDIVESGKTLKENGLSVLETISTITARLVVNRVSMKIESDRINAFVGAVKKVLHAEREVK